MKRLWDNRSVDWKWRLANGYRDKGDECPAGLEYRWDGALTTTPDLAEDLASLTLDGLPTQCVPR